MPPMSEPLLILASRSPRRLQLLREAGFEPRQVSPSFADPAQPAPSDDPTQLAIDLAEAKARDVARAVRGTIVRGRRAIILAADTICVDQRGRLIGTPSDRDEAFRTLRAFINARHEVTTGVALLRLSDDKLVTFADTVTVAWGPVDDATLERYLASDQWQGKAGGYNLFERQREGWPITLAPNADATTVVGLPMKKVVAALGDQGVVGFRRVGV